MEQVKLTRTEEAVAAYEKMWSTEVGPVPEHPDSMWKNQHGGRWWFLLRDDGAVVVWGTDVEGVKVLRDPLAVASGRMMTPYIMSGSEKHWFLVCMEAARSTLWARSAARRAAGGVSATAMPPTSAQEVRVRAKQPPKLNRVKQAAIQKAAEQAAVDKMWCPTRIPDDTRAQSTWVTAHEDRWWMSLEADRSLIVWGTGEDVDGARVMKDPRAHKLEDVLPPWERMGGAAMMWLAACVWEAQTALDLGDVRKEWGEDD